jgi:hypothetical protein
MKWVSHYTGHDYAESDWCGINLYLIRDTESHKLTFVRLSWRAWPHKWHRMLGVFIGRLNSLQRISPSWTGWEVFTRHIGFGWCAGENKFRRVSWVDANLDCSRLVMRVWRLGFVCRVPKFVQRWKDQREQPEWAAMAEAYEAQMRKEMGEEGYAAYRAHYAALDEREGYDDPMGDWHGRNM